RIVSSVIKGPPSAVLVADGDALVRWSDQSNRVTRVVSNPVALCLAASKGLTLPGRHGGERLHAGADLDLLRLARLVDDRQRKRHGVAFLERPREVHQH